MKNLCKCLAAMVGLMLSTFCHSQEVTNLTEVTANGGVSVDAAGNLLVAHFGPLPPNPNIGKNIYKITPEGTVALFVDGQLNVGSGNAIDADGCLYQSNFATNVIYKIGPDGTIIDNNYASVSGPVGIAAAPDNTLYVCSCNQNIVKKITPDGQISNFASGNFFNCANGITMDHEGNIYTTNFSDGRITKITPDGTAITLGNTMVGNGHIVYRPVEDMLYVASYSGHRIFKMDLTGNVELFAGTGTAGSENAVDPLQATFNKPNGINISKDNCSLYITQDDNVLRAILFNDASCLTNIEKIEDYPDLKMYPNPASNTLALENRSDLDFVSAQFFDSQGKLIQRTPVAANRSLHFDISTFPIGIFNVLLHSTTGQVFSYRFVKQR